MTPDFDEAPHCPWHLLPWTSLGWGHTIWRNRPHSCHRRANSIILCILQGGLITVYLPHIHHHPPLCFLRNSLIPAVIFFLCNFGSLAHTLSHQSSFVLCDFGKRWGERGQRIDQRMCNVLSGLLPGAGTDPVHSPNWSHILVIK